MFSVRNSLARQGVFYSEANSQEITRPRNFGVLQRWEEISIVFVCVKTWHTISCRTPQLLFSQVQTSIYKHVVSISHNDTCHTNRPSPDPRFLSSELAVVSGLCQHLAKAFVFSMYITCLWFCEMSLWPRPQSSSLWVWTHIYSLWACAYSFITTRKPPQESQTCPWKRLNIHLLPKCSSTQWYIYSNQEWIRVIPTNSVPSASLLVSFLTQVVPQNVHRSRKSLHRNMTPGTTGTLEPMTPLAVTTRHPLPSVNDFHQASPTRRAWLILEGGGVFLRWCPRAPPRGMGAVRLHPG